MKGGKKTVILCLIILVFIFLSGIYIGIEFKLDDSETTNIFNATAFIISTVALMFTMVTYFSIDSMDKKNRMENNILQAQNYKAPYQRIFDYLNVSENEYRKNLIKSIKKPRIASCMQFADWIQTIMDHIVFFAYCDFDSDEREKLKKSLDKEKGKYEGIGSEVKIILNENISLIKYVLDYQKRDKDNSNRHIEDVRGEMLGNPVAKIVYYDYLGLDYLHMAGDIMNKKVGKHKVFSEDYFKSWRQNNTFKEKEKCLSILDEANKYFESAIRLTQDDLMWDGYIKYNLVRVNIMRFLLLNNKAKKIAYGNILKSLNTTILARKKVCHLFSESGYLYDQFQKELQMVIDLKSNFTNVF